MSSDLLRRAAALMRERAEVATPGPWESAKDDCCGGPDVISLDHGVVVEEWHVDEPDATHIASWHPLVALAVATMLEVEDRHPFGPSAEVIEIARTYLGNDE